LRRPRAVHDQLLARRQRHDLLTPISEKYIVSNKESVGPPLNKGRKRRVEVTFAACIKDTQLLSDGSSCHLEVSRLEVGIGKWLALMRQGAIRGANDCECLPVALAIAQIAEMRKYFRFGARDCNDERAEKTRA
jgi:hypothetical protein